MRMRISLAAALVAATSSLHAQAARLDSLGRAVVASGRAASVSMAVVRGRDTLLLAAYGKADLEQDVAATPATVYRIGSTTKQFTAAAILQLAERGKLALDDEVTKYVPDVDLQGRRVTLRQLLDHTSGIADYTSLGDAFNGISASDVPQDSLVAQFARAPFTFEPGTGWSYSNSGYFLLGMVIERVTGMTWGDYLRAEVFPKAGLTQTYVCNEHDVIPHRARGYELENGRLINTQYLAMSLPYSAGSLCSTPRDMVRWERALGSGKVVSPKSFALMTTSTGAALKMSPGDTTLHYGFAEMMQTVDGHRQRGHGGAINGFGSFLTEYPDDSLVISVLVNTAGPVATIVGRQAAMIVFGGALRPWSAAPSVDAPAAKPFGAAERTRYVGRYLLRLGGNDPRSRPFAMTLRVYDENGRLMVWSPGQAPDRLLSVGGDAFVSAQDPTVRVTFTMRDGRAVHVRVASAQGTLEGDRVDAK